MRKLYLLYDGWHARGYGAVNPHWEGPGFSPAELSEWLEMSRHPGVEWGFCEAREAVSTACRASLMPAAAGDRETDGLEFKPAWWWAGSGANAVRGHGPDEMATMVPAVEIGRVAEMMRRACRGWRGCGGVEVLGWVVEELE